MKDPKWLWNDLNIPSSRLLPLPYRQCILNYTVTQHIKDKASSKLEPEAILWLSHQLGRKLWLSRSPYVSRGIHGSDKLLGSVHCSFLRIFWITVCSHLQKKNSLLNQLELLWHLWEHKFPWMCKCEGKSICLYKYAGLFSLNIDIRTLIDFLTLSLSAQLRSPRYVPGLW